MPQPSTLLAPEPGYSPIVGSLVCLRAIDDAWLVEQFELPWRKQPATNLWAWYHVGEDELNHRGQIRWLASRLPSRAAATPS